MNKYVILQIIAEVGDVPFKSTTESDDKEKAERTALTGIENENFPKMKEWIKNFLKDKSEVPT